jgi:hypothetical protein
VRFIDFIVIERRNFCRPITRRVCVAPVHNTTIIQKTVNITKIKVVNHVAVNQGPQVTKIERATRERVQIHNVRDVVKKPRHAVLRKNDEPVHHERETRKVEHRVAVAEPTPAPAPSPSYSSPSPAKKTDRDERPYRRTTYQNVPEPAPQPAVREERARPVPRYTSPAPQQTSPPQREPAVRAQVEERHKDVDQRAERRMQREERSQPRYVAPAQQPNRQADAPSQRGEKVSRKEQARDRDAHVNPGSAPAEREKRDSRDKQSKKHDADSD